MRGRKVEEINDKRSWECLHLWWGPWSSKPVESLNKALCGFDSHTLPLFRLALNDASLFYFALYVNHTVAMRQEKPALCQKKCQVLEVTWVIFDTILQTAVIVDLAAPTPLW